MPARSNPERCEFLAKLLGCPGLPVRFPNTRHPEDRNEHVDLMIRERRPLIDCSLDVLNKGAALIAITATPVPMFHASPFKCAKLITNCICGIGLSPVLSAVVRIPIPAPSVPGEHDTEAAVRARTACGVGGKATDAFKQQVDAGPGKCTPAGRMCPRRGHSRILGNPRAVAITKIRDANAWFRWLPEKLRQGGGPKLPTSDLGPPALHSKHNLRFG